MIIDCDVHHNRKSSEELLPYLKEPWKSELVKYGRRCLSSGVMSHDGANRGDTNPPSGGNPGTDPEYMKQQ